MAKKAPNKKEKERMSRVVELGCVICKRPAEIHHITGTSGLGARANHLDTIGLCPEHHRTGNLGIGLHNGIRTWEENFGSQIELLEEVNQQLN